MSSPYYQKGNTVRLTGRFYDWADQPTDPEAVKLLILNDKYQVIKTVSAEEIKRQEIGVYHYYYVTDTIGILYYEWNGTINGYPSLKRRSIIVKEV